MRAAQQVDDVPTGDAAAGVRSRREQRIAEIRRRRAVVAAASPDLDAQTTNMVVNADSLWGPDEGWRGFAVSPENDEASPAHVSTPAPAAGASPGRRSFLKKLRRRRVESAESDEQVDTDPVAEASAVQGVEAPGVLEVPRPGQRLRRTGRGRSWIVRTAVVVSPLVLVGGVTYSCGVHDASQRLVQPSQIGDQDAARFHLSTYPAAAAAAFGATYLSICLTHPGDDLGRGNRAAALAGMTSSGVSPGCGWDGTGPQQQPLSVSWTGTQSPAAGSYPEGVAEQLDFTAAMPGDRVIGVSLPIWAASTAGGPFLVVGDPAFLPAAIPTTAPIPAQPSTVDSGLAESLTPTVLTPFLTAWAASDQVQLGLVLATNASAAATRGLSGQLTNPSVDTAQIVVQKGNPSKGYHDGDLVSAQIAVTWQTAGVTQESAYTISLRLTSGHWLVTDITAGAVDAAGGAAPNTAFPTPTSGPSSSSPTTTS